MCEISCVLEGNDLKDLSVSNIVCHKYARLVSCDVERTFYQYKSFFRDNRHRFTVHNLKMTFLVHCNSASLSVGDSNGFRRVLCVITSTFFKEIFSTFRVHFFYF
jgi:hypothetical protein